jgi:hypothetical protein
MNTDDVVRYFEEKTGVPKDFLEAFVEDGLVCLFPKRWLNDGWGKIMELVYTMDGEWVRDGKNSHWWFDAVWIEGRIADMKAEGEAA